MKKYLLSILLAFTTLLCFAQTEQKATVWGVKSDGVTDNTGSIQRAIDYISAHGGGTLYFYVGRYLTQEQCYDPPGGSCRPGGLDQYL